MRGQMDDSIALRSDLGAHTPEPWAYNASRGTMVGFLITARNEGIARTTGLHYDSEANARRIVACVNAAEGISTEALEASKDFAAAGIATVKSIEAQRDELAEALRECLGLIIVQNGNLHQDINKVIARADAVLTKLDTGTEVTSEAAAE